MWFRWISFLPFSLLYALAWLCYLLLYYVFRYRREVVRTNLANAFPEKSVAERRKL